MDVRDAVASRFSCRAFLPTPVPLAVVREILDRAARAPSGGNLQPWPTHWHKTVPPFLDLPADHILFCGIALGVGDESAAVNRWRAPRAGVEEFATFRGFAKSDMPQC